MAETEISPNAPVGKSLKTLLHATHRQNNCQSTWGGKFITKPIFTCQTY